VTWFCLVFKQTVSVAIMFKLWFLIGDTSHQIFHLMPDANWYYADMHLSGKMQTVNTRIKQAINFLLVWIQVQSKSVFVQYFCAINRKLVFKTDQLRCDTHTHREREREREWERKRERSVINMLKTAFTRNHQLTFHPFPLQLFCEAAPSSPWAD